MDLNKVEAKDDIFRSLSHEAKNSTEASQDLLKLVTLLFPDAFTEEKGLSITPQEGLRKLLDTNDVSGSLPKVRVTVVALHFFRII